MKTDRELLEARLGSAAINQNDKFLIRRFTGGINELQRVLNILPAGISVRQIALYDSPVVVFDRDPDVHELLKSPESDNQ